MTWGVVFPQTFHALWWCAMVRPTLGAEGATQKQNLQSEPFSYLSGQLETQQASLVGPYEAMWLPPARNESIKWKYLQIFRYYFNTRLIS